MIVGNSALIKCEIPSFVADFVSVVSWVENNGLEYFPNHIGTSFFFSCWETQAVTLYLEVFFKVFAFSAALANNEF